MSGYVYIPTRFQWRMDTAANWTANNPTPLKGEPCLEWDTGKYKIGDGVTAWNSLNYYCAVPLADPGVVAFVAFDPVTDKWKHYPLGAGLSVVSGEIVAGGGGGSDDPESAEYFCTHYARGTTLSTATGTSFNLSACPVIYTGGAGGSYSVTPVSGRPAQLVLTTGASATGYARIFASAGLFYIPGGGLTQVGANITLPNLSTGTQRFEVGFGFGDAISGATTNRIEAIYRDDINGGNWRLRVINAGVTTNVDTSNVGPAAATEQKVELEINAAGTSVTLYVDGVSKATAAVSITAAMALALGITKTVGTTARTCVNDFIDFRQTFTTPR